MVMTEVKRTHINVAEVPRMIVRLRQLESVLESMVSDCPYCGGGGSYVEHDDVTGSDLWRDCGRCRPAREALETSHD